MLKNKNSTDNVDVDSAESCQRMMDGHIRRQILPLQKKRTHSMRIVLHHVTFLINENLLL